MKRNALAAVPGREQAGGSVPPRPLWVSVRHTYRKRSGEAAGLERERAWDAAADAWLAALEVAVGENVRWCRDRHAWCVARSLKPGS